MPTTATSTATTSTATIPPPPAPAFTLWFRERRGRAWEPVAHCPTERACYDAIETSGRHNGDWLTLPAGQQP